MRRTESSDQLMIAGQLPAAWRLGGGEALEGCLQLAQGMVDGLHGRMGGEQGEKVRCAEALAEAEALLGTKAAVGVNELGLAALFAGDLSPPLVWTGIAVSRISSRRVRVRGPGSHGGIVLAWSREDLAEAPGKLPLKAGFLPPGVCAQAVILDEEVDKGLPVTGRGLRAEVIWEARGVSGSPAK